MDFSADLSPATLDLLIHNWLADAITRALRATRPEVSFCRT